MTIALPVDWAITTLYTSGPDIGTATKVAPATPLVGFVRDQVIAPQEVNFLLSQYSIALRRMLAVSATQLRPTAVVFAQDASAGLAAFAPANRTMVLVKGGTDGGQRLARDGWRPSAGGVNIGLLVDTIRGGATNGSRLVVIGASGGTSRSASSTDSGVTWTAGSALTGASNPQDIIWDGTQFIVMAGTQAHHDVNGGPAWTAATTSPAAAGLSSTNAGLAQVGSAAAYAAGLSSGGTPTIVRSLDHGATWSNVGTIPGGSGAYATAGYIAGHQPGGGLDTEFYWLQTPIGGAQLDLYSSPDGSTWTARSSFSAQVTGATAGKLYVCRDTGLLVAVCAHSSAGNTYHVRASLDRGLSWTEPMYAVSTSRHAFAVAAGRLFNSSGGACDGTDGIGAGLTS